MDQHSGNNVSQPQSTNHSSTISNPSLPLGAGRQASILQVGGQSFLILTTGQPDSPLQGLGLNLVPVSGPDASSLQTGGPQTQLLQVGGGQSTVSQIGESKPLVNQSGKDPHHIVQIHGLQPSTVQLGPGVQPQTIQANELKFKSSQSISPLATTVQSGGLQSSLVQDGNKFSLQSANLQIHTPKIKSESGVKDSVPSVLAPSSGVLPPLTQIARAQPSIVQFGGPVTSSVQVASTIPLEMVKAENIPLPTCKIEGQSAADKSVHPATVVQNSGAMPPLKSAGRVRPNIVQFGGLQSSSAQVACTVPTQTEFSQAYDKIKIEPGLEDDDIKPLTIQDSGCYSGIAKLIGFAAQVQSSLFQPSLQHVGGFQSLAPQENPKSAAITKRNKQPLTKKGYKCPQETPKYVDVACSAYNLVKMKHASTNTTKRNKSIGTQAKLSLTNKSQAVQFPENSYGEPDIPTYQECSTQSEESFWPGQVDFQQSSESLPYKVVIVRDPEPENVSLFLSETSHGDGDRAWNMEEVEKLINGSYEVEYPHFDDVAVYFSEEEWALLNDKEKKLYKKVMMDNYWNLMAVGKISVTPPVISKIESREEPCMRSLQQPDHMEIYGADSSRDDPSSQNIFGEYYNMHSFYERLKAITYPIKLAMAGLTVTRMMSGMSSYEPSQAAQAEDRIRDPGEQCPFKSFLKEKPAINEKPFRCFKCERAFKRFGNLMSHYRVHQSEEDLTCDECGKKFTKMKAFLLHYMRHTGARPFICSGCGKTFASQVCLNNHYGLNSKKKQYECLDCGKRFGLKHSLIKHEKLHQLDTRNVCLICGKEFSHKAGLRLHERVHGTHYICTQCGRYFSNKDDYEKHMLDHMQMQLFVCPECGNAFMYESQLLEHQKLHQGNYPNPPYPDLVIKIEEEDD